MASRFKVEHVAVTPHGYKVRTVARDGHRVRIAFPPGRRVAGSGQVVEVLHPRNENPCRLPNPSELVVMMANPSAVDADGAARMYEDFHGEPAKRVTTYDEPEPRPQTLAQLGTLVELQVNRPGGRKWGVLDFQGQGVQVGANAAGTQIYFVGGNQKVSRGQITDLRSDNSKELIDLGECMAIAYRARKAQVNGIASDYEHHFGEDTGVRPRLMYDRRGPEPRLLLAGGQYSARIEGIVN